MAKIWKIVAAGSVSSPPRTRSSAARCAGVARRSSTSTHSPLPSWMGPGQPEMAAAFSPSS